MYAILIYSILAEVAILFITLIYIAILRIFSPYLEKKNQKIQKELSSIIVSHITQFQQNSKTFSSPLFASYNNLLQVLENFEKRFKDDAWNKIKDEICRRYLLPRARKRVRSWFWKKRLFAARILALSPQTEDASGIALLIKDRLFLVSSHAIRAAISLETRELLFQVLDKMHLLSGYPYYFCRDLLMHGSNKLFNWIEEFASESKSKTFRWTLLDLLSTKPYPLIRLDLTEDLNTKSPERRLCGVRLLSRNPQPNSKDVLLNALEDKNDKIRAEAARGLHFFPEEICFKKLNHALNDEVWDVRLEAGIALKKMGEKGGTILEKQNSTSHPEAYEVAHYVLRFY
ncbi:MAG: hypothetical protein K1000chlam4_00303 [Chlamydiae bacterium]|nr:hypothetical protein [Chlamydiota bacterium]